METQSYENHAHNPTLTRVGSLFLLIAWTAFVLRWFLIGGRYMMALDLGSLSLAVMVLLLMSRAYTTRLQDRIIRLEMRIRGADLLTPEQQRLLAQCTIKQVAALRFASDAELAGLVERAAREHLKPDEIKRAIQVWVPDYDRA